MPTKPASFENEKAAIDWHYDQYQTILKKLSTLYKTELEQLLELDIKLDRLETVHEKNMQDCM